MQSVTLKDAVSTGEDAGVADLSAHLGIEGSFVQDDHALLALGVLLSTNCAVDDEGLDLGRAQLVSV